MNAKLFKKLLEQTKTDAARIKQLTKERDLAIDARDAAIAAAVTQVRGEELARYADLNQQLVTASDQLITVIQAHDSDRAQFRKVLAEYQVQLVHADEEIGTHKRINVELNRQLGEALEKVAELQPQLELLEQKKLELAQLLDKVRDRMRRKERLEEQAILNRKAATFQPYNPITVPRRRS